MALTSLERDFLQRLSTEPWASPPLFDHNLVARLVEAGYVPSGYRSPLLRYLLGRPGSGMMFA